VDRNKTPWIIVIGHRAMYCTKNEDEECNEEALAVRNGVYVNSTKLFDGVEPLLLEFGVDLFFGGHTHHYMRTWPVKKDALVQVGLDFSLFLVCAVLNQDFPLPFNQKNYINPKGPVHVQSGIGGVNGHDPFDLPMKVRLRSDHFSRPFYLSTLTPLVL